MIVDLFAGCGGWDVGARLAGLPDPIGFELDPAACATRVAAQMPTIRADLDGYPPRGRITGLIGSPPCTDFSTAGKQAGRDGATGHLVDVPLAWALALQPDWLAWEQVPPVLPIWEQHAAVLERHGYLCWTGIVCAADYGVPQTRRRAVLLARRDRRPCPPMPTHCETGGMFTQRWVSMADALGWPPSTLDRRNNGAPVMTVTDRPAPTVTFVGLGKSQWVAETEDGERLPIVLADALILQSFPPDFPVQGTRTAQFRQIGNAVPPRLAQVLLEAVSGP